MTQYLVKITLIGNEKALEVLINRPTNVLVVYLHLKVLDRDVQRDIFQGHLIK